ncbi:hypothetical protein JCM33374_g3789 [Metschnikowia sp. JCM 33374]|nr:hypothetical protein JCM33374_g3789 [Metschnikowia sp. JCM 33374]
MSASKQAVFPPEVLARITPEVSLERHLALGLRPSLRQYDEFRTLSANLGSLTGLGTNSLVGSATVKNGDTHAFCGITLGISEINDSDDFISADSSANKNAGFASVYPVVEIARGRTGAPTDEEMILSQRVHNHVLHSHILPAQSLAVVPGYQLTNETTGETYVAYPDDKQMSEDDLRNLSSTINITKKKYTYVLYAHIKTSPLASPLRMDDTRVGVSSSFGLVDVETAEGPETVLLADLEGEAEEACAESRVTIVRNDGLLSHVNITGGGANVTLETLRKASRIAKNRANVVKY